MTLQARRTQVDAVSPPPQSLGTAEAKRRFSELVDRVGEGERFLVSRRGRPAVALVPPEPDLFERSLRPPTGLAAAAGALAEWAELNEVVGEIYAARGGSVDRPPPDLGWAEVYCFDTDVLSATMRREPSLPLIRRLAQVPPAEQFTTAITLGELLYGAERRDSARLRERVREVVSGALTVLPFDEAAAATYGVLRAGLEVEGRRIDEPDARIASIALSRELTLVTGNVRHFSRVPGLTVENWLAAWPSDLSR